MTSALMPRLQHGYRPDEEDVLREVVHTNPELSVNAYKGNGHFEQDVKMPNLSEPNRVIVWRQEGDNTEVT